jgi:hypothetical protein
VIFKAVSRAARRGLIDSRPDLGAPISIVADSGRHVSAQNSIGQCRGPDLNSVIADSQRAQPPTL